MAMDFNLPDLELSLLARTFELVEEFLLEKYKLPDAIKLDRSKRCLHLLKCLLQEKDNGNIPIMNVSILLDFLIWQKDEETHKSRFEYVLNNSIFDENSVSFFGRSSSPLHYAICLQNFERVKRLVKRGADVNELSYHRSPLLLACGGIFTYIKSFQPSDELNRFFSHKTGVNKDNIHEFAFCSKIVKYLLDHGADIEAKNGSNRTSLDQASKLGKCNIVKLLLSRGAKIDQGDLSTLHHAIRGGNKDVVDLILKQGARVNYICGRERMWYHPHNYVPLPPRTPLEYALKYIHCDFTCFQVINLLKEYGANVNVTDPVRRETALHLAYHSSDRILLSGNKLTGRPRAITLLLSFNPDVNALDSRGFVPLHYALRNYNILNNAQRSFSHSFNYLKAELKALIAYIARMMENNEPVIMQNLVLLEDKIVHPLYQDCLNELNLMKMKICKSRNLSFRNILSKDVHFLSLILRNEDVYRVLNSRREYQKKFPIYGEYLEFRIMQAKFHKKQVDLAVRLFYKHVNNKLVGDIIFNIIQYLDNIDLTNFAKAFC